MDRICPGAGKLAVHHDRGAGGVQYALCVYLRDRPAGVSVPAVYMR